jgi:protein associated with RNAse G/E
MDGCESRKLYRKRYFPDEIVYLKDDVILQYEENLIITKWKSLHPRPDVAGGVSAYVMDKNWKISKMFDERKHLVRWYCDILTADKSGDKIVFTDLLIDVIVTPDGVVHVVDMDELGDYIKNGTIDADTACVALHAANELLEAIESGEFERYQELIDSFEI